jgi:hypothetical protein
MSQNKSSFDLSRRQFIAGAAGLGLTTLASGLIVPSAFAQEATPKRGGVLKLGIGGGSTTDNFDIRVLQDWVPVNQAYMTFNGLVEIDKDNMVQPELFEGMDLQDPSGRHLPQWQDVDGRGHSLFAEPASRRGFHFRGAFDGRPVCRRDQGLGQ